jgi:hypothetical protein
MLFSRFLAGCWKLASIAIEAGYWILDAGYWTLDAGCLEDSSRTGMLFTGFNFSKVWNFGKDCEQCCLSESFRMHMDCKSAGAGDLVFNELYDD